MNLVVDAAKHVPGGRTVAKLIDSGKPVIADFWSKVGEILNPAAAISHRAIDLKIKGRVDGLHVVEVSSREDAIPEWRVGLQAQAANNFEVGIERVEHLAVHQRIVVVAQKRLAKGLHQHADIGIVISRAKPRGETRYGNRFT